MVRYVQVTPCGDDFEVLIVVKMTASRTMASQRPDSSSGVEGDDKLGPEGRGELDGRLLVDVGGDPEVGEVQIPRPGWVGQRQHAHHRHPAHPPHIFERKRQKVKI